MSNRTLQTALKEVVGQVRTSLAVFAAPLALLFSQLRGLTDLQSALVDSLVTISMIALIIGVTLTLTFLQIVQVLLIRLALEEDGVPQDEQEPGTLYYRYLIGDFSEKQMEFNEKTFVAYARSTYAPFLICMLAGYGPLFAIFFIVVWG